MQELKNENDIEKKNKARTLFFAGPFLAGLCALIIFAGVDFPGWLLAVIFLVTFPLTVWYVNLKWKYFSKQVKGEEK